MAVERFQMTLLGAFAAIGLLLATAGIYGLIAYSVAQRTREFGIRDGAGRHARAILSVGPPAGRRLALAGVAVGCVAAAFATRVLRNFVWGVSTLDATTFVAVAAVLIAVACGASLVRRCGRCRLNPVNALRE